MNQNEQFSKNLNFKSLIQPTKEQFEVCIYQWNPEKTDEDGLPMWERCGGPFLVDDAQQAEEIAQENLNLLSGEIPDLTIEKGLTEELESLLGADNFCFFKPENFTVRYLKDPLTETFETITPTKLLWASDFYFAEQGGLWYGGFLDESGMVQCWTEEQHLTDALKVLEDQKEETS